MIYRSIYFISLLMASSLSIASSVSNFFTYPPIKNYYVELSFDRSKYGYDSYTSVNDFYIDPGTFKHMNNAIAIALGARYINNSAFQLNFTHVDNFSVDFNNGNTKQYLDSIILDGIYFINIIKNLELKLFSGAGLYNVKFKTTYQDSGATITDNQNVFDLIIRAGAGLQYSFNQTLAINFVYKYQCPLEKIKYISGFSVGLVYNFMN